MMDGRTAATVAVLAVMVFITALSLRWFFHPGDLVRITPATTSTTEDVTHVTG